LGRLVDVREGPNVRLSFTGFLRSEQHDAASRSFVSDSGTRSLQSRLRT
jgi:hypothetical protein